MRTNLVIGAVILAAGLVMPAAFGQTPAPRARRASGVESVEVPYLGIGGQDVTPERAKALRLKEDRGAEVTGVYPDSAAAKAGLKESDVILEYNGEKVEGWEHLRRLVRETPIHREVKIVVWRNGALQSLNATMGSQHNLQVEMGNGDLVMPNIRVRPMAPVAPTPPTPPQMEIPQFQMLMSTSVLGITCESLAPESQLAEFFGVKGGVLVRSVNKGSAAEKAGLKAGDVVTKIDDTAIFNPQQIGGALRSTHGKAPVNITVVRNKKEMTLTLTPDSGNVYRGGPVEQGLQHLGAALPR